MCFIAPMLTAGVGHLWGQAQISNQRTHNLRTVALELFHAERGGADLEILCGLRL